MTEADRFWAKVAAGPNGCIVWTASRCGGRGARYGSFTTAGRKTVGAHVWAYRTMVRPIPEGLEIDHTCRNSLCVNHLHLEVVTQEENKRRQAAATTHCPQGHAYDEANTYVDRRNHRQCRKCNNVRRRRYDKPLTAEQRARKAELQRARRAALNGETP